MTRDRRIHGRTSAKIRACLRHGDDAIEGVVENFGEGGVFFATEILDSVVDDGTDVTLEFEGTRDGVPVAFRLPGQVLRTERYFDGQAVVRAFAIRFTSIQDFTGIAFGA